ncbi:Imm50 family immunity protein [Pseudomonas viridiflava]|uniref:Imm50 family immunity protein n=1 Tax=Pseudomonas viridiflava TaxID=33069 RepID=UPI0016051F23|nr:Imm50 family immunity protein [Pseudomonas viridiflava]
MKPEELINSAELVIEAIGFWPSFHDAEVISFSVSRALPDQGSATVAKLCIHYREHDAVGVGTADFEYVCQKSLLVELIFSEIHDLSLTDFNPQNVLESIDLKRSQDLSILVDIVSIWGIGGTIRCNHVAVGAVTNLLP